MSVTITIQGTPIQFPSSGRSPNWAPAVIQFAQAVEEALQGVVGPGDVSAQVTDLLNNQAAPLDIPALTFPNGTVRVAFINYYIFRTDATPSTLLEQGEIQVAYNPANGSGLKWELSQQRKGGSESGVEFTMTDAGVMQYTSSNMTGGSYTGKIGFSAKALTQT